MRKWVRVAAVVLVLLPILYSINPLLSAFVFLTGVIFLNRNFSVIKGAIGERKVNRLLNKLGPNYTLFHDLYLPTEKGTTQVDHIVTSPYGIFVIETKHYDGWIFGDEYSKYWTQVIYKRKERMLNPIRQNYGHIQALKNSSVKNTMHIFIQSLHFRMPRHSNSRTTLSLREWFSFWTCIRC